MICYISHIYKLNNGLISLHKFALTLRRNCCSLALPLLNKNYTIWITITRRTRSSQLMLLIGLLYLCIAESVPQVHPIQPQHLNCGIVYQQTSETQDIRHFQETLKNSLFNIRTFLWNIILVILLFYHI